MAVEDTINNTVPEQLNDEDRSSLENDLKDLNIGSVENETEVEVDAETEDAREAREAAEDASSDLNDEEREAIRERRRKERQDKKNYRKTKEDSYRREIEGLRKQLSEVNEWKNTVEQRRVNSGVAQLDRALKDSLEAVEVAKRAIAEATDTNNGAALVDAQELYYAARRRAEGIHQVKQQITQRMQQRPQQNIDPNVVKNAHAWMNDKPWYDPTGKDQDSRITLTIDNAMAEEGWDPRTPEYWEELDSRVKKYLPHRYNSGYTERTRDGQKPPVSGSSQSRSSTSSSNFTLSPERVRAMKDAGYWDDPEKRKAMIKRYIEQDRTAKNS